MDARTREKKLKELVDNCGEPYSSKQLVYKDKPCKINVYPIPVEFLIFNQYNGRIGTFVKQYEKLHSPIDATTPEGEKQIMKFLWDSKESRNKETMADLKIKGQLEFGIVTKDGVIIDGNRRCMLLKMLAEEMHQSPTYFYAAILDETIESNPKEIRRLETTFQMGVDAKVDYNPIEKYLKCQELISDGFTEKEIGKMMGEKELNIKKYLKTLRLMEDYLSSNGYEGMYRVLGETNVEGPLLELCGYLEPQRIQGRDWTPDEDDKDDLKKVYFDIIRALKGGTHDIRHIGDPAKGQGLFNFKDLWKNRSDQLFEEIEPIKENEKTLEELRVERPGESVESIITGREEDYRKAAGSVVKKFLGLARQDLDNKGVADKPIALLERALNSLQQINTEPETFDGTDVMSKCHEIRKLAEGFLRVLKDKERDRGR